MAHQEALTIVAKVDPARTAALDAVMRQMALQPGHDDVLPFSRVRGCHFGRVLSMPASTDLAGKRVEPQLIMLSDCDGDADAHIETIVDAAGSGMDKLFGNCSGYPKTAGENGRARELRVQFLREHRLRTKANYVHKQGRSVEQIRREADLRTALEEYADEHALHAKHALEARRQLRTFVWSTPRFVWAREPAEPLDLGYKLPNALHFFTLPFALVAFGPVLVPATALLVWLVRRQELRDPAPHVRPTLEHARALAELEDHFAHNGFTAAGYVKTGPVRRAVIEAVLPLIGWGTRHLFTQESLAGVKTIHFARWIPIDEGRRVVFASNYDGSLESYNNDFIDLVSYGLNLVFSNGYGYPRTRFLLFEGAQREQEFKDFLRRHQVPTPVWYSAYPELTAVNVARNAELRAGLYGPMTEREAQAWLRLL